MPGALRWRRFLDDMRTGLWPLPVAALVIAAALGVALPRLDEATGDAVPPSVSAFLFGGGAGSAQTVLSAVATSLITVTSLTFSLTVLTLQLASSNYSPRLLRTFTRDRFVQRTLALFVGSFVYALTVLRTVRTSDGGREAFVPQLSVTVAYGLTLASALGLVLFLAHLAREIRVETVLRNVHKDADSSIDRVLGQRETSAELPREPPREAVLRLLAPSSGFVVAVHADVLCAAARDVDAVVVVDKRVGDALVAGTPVARAWSASGDALSEEGATTLREQLEHAIATGFERTAQQDVAFGLRQLTDVALKALSPSTNDPTTAVHALNHSAALLGDLLHRDLGAEMVRDDQKTTRVYLRQWSFPELLDLAVDQPRIYGAADPLVLTALGDLLAAVAWLDADHGQAPAVLHHLSRLRRTIEREGHDATPLEALLPPSYPATAGVSQARSDGGSSARP